MAILRLTNSDRVAVIDDIDAHWISQREWALDGRGYVVCYLFGRRNASPKSVQLHRLITLAPDTMTVDHWDRDTLNNRRSNLRVATQSQQNANRAKFKGASQYKGVFRRRDGLKWCAQVSWKGWRYSLGSFEDEVDAARAYNYAATKLMGDFARLNEVSEPLFLVVELRPTARKKRIQKGIPCS